MNPAATIPNAVLRIVDERPKKAKTRNGHPTQPETFESIRDQRNYAVRALRQMTAGIAKLERYARVVAEMNWNRPDEAVRHCRAVTFNGLYPADLPLCAIERAMVEHHHNGLCVLVAYEVVAPAIARELGAMLRERAEKRAAGAEASKRSC